MMIMYALLEVCIIYLGIVAVCIYPCGVVARMLCMLYQVCT